MFRKMILAVATAAALIVGFSFNQPEVRRNDGEGAMVPAWPITVTVAAITVAAITADWRGALLSSLRSSVLRALSRYGPYGY